MCIARTEYKEYYFEMGIVNDFKGKIHILRNPRYPYKVTREKQKDQQRTKTASYSYNTYSNTHNPDLHIFLEMLVYTHFEWIQQNLNRRKSREKDTLQVGPYNLILTYVNSDRYDPHTSTGENHLYREKYVTPQMGVL